MINWIEVSPDWTLGVATQILWMIAGSLFAVAGVILAVSIAAAIRGELEGETCGQLGKATRRERRQLATGVEQAPQPALIALRAVEF